MSTKKISINAIDAFIFDFDGVLTDNKVYFDQDGQEMVVCSRADGLAFDALKKLHKPTFIVSSEKNPIVYKRGRKLRVKTYQNISNKRLFVEKLVKKNGYNKKKIFFIGNDVNDYNVMKYSGITACPKDSHRSIKKIADFTLDSNGGDGVVRELLEKVIGINLLALLYSDRFKDIKIK